MVGRSYISRHSLLLPNGDDLLSAIAAYSYSSVTRSIKTYTQRGLVQVFTSEGHPQ